MIEAQAISPELTAKAREKLELDYSSFLGMDAKPINRFVPKNAAEQKKAFLEDDNIRRPDHVYDRLEGLDFEVWQAELGDIGDKIVANSSIDPKQKEAYEQVIASYQQKLALVRIAHDYKHSNDAETRRLLAAEYHRINVELYGELDENLYRTLLAKEVNGLDATKFTGQARAIYDELLAIVDNQPPYEKVALFRPSEETVEWVQEVAWSLFGNLLEHVPTNKDQFESEDIREVFETVIREEFGDAADEWRVVIEPATSINVVSSEKKIIIPQNMLKPFNYTTMCLKVVHELGIHFLLSVMGEQSDLLPLRTGLADFYDADEGRGKVFEQALVGVYKSENEDYYIAAGGLQFDNKDFRDVHDLLWRLKFLRTYKGEATIDADVAKAKSNAYQTTFRMTRGTDELLWQLNTGYYKGTQSMWEYFESIRGDDIKFLFALIGKIDPSNINDERLAYESRTY